MLDSGSDYKEEDVEGKKDDSQEKDDTEPLAELADNEEGYDQPPSSQDFLALPACFDLAWRV